MKLQVHRICSQVLCKRLLDGISNNEDFSPVHSLFPSVSMLAKIPRFLILECTLRQFQ